MTKSYVLKAAILVGLFLSSVVMSKPVLASITITPVEIMFGGRDRYKDITLVNTGDTVKNYEMKFVYHKMTPEGAYVFVEGLGEEEFDLSKHIVFSPRKVRLEPGAKQRVRLALRRPAEIPLGDHHVGLMFESKALEKNTTDDDIQLETGQAKAGMVINVSYSIPVILREGDPDNTVEFGQLEFERNKGSGLLDALVTIKRVPEGNPYGVLGYLGVYHIDSDGNEEKVGELINPHVFPEVDSRTFRVIIKKDIDGGSLRFVLSKEKRSDEIIAERTFVLEK